MYKNPGFTIVALLTLALGIGANTAIFAVLNAVILRPLHFKEPERLVRVYSQFQGTDMNRFWLSGPEYLDLKGNTKSWEAMGAYLLAGNGNLTGITEPIQINALFATSDLFGALGVQPMLGRLLSPDDDFRGGVGTVLISHGLWERAFGGRPEIVGQTFGLDGAKVTIIGVMPAEFKFPPSDSETIDVWIPLRIDPANPGDRSRHRLSVLGRLRPGVTLIQARAEMDQLLQTWTNNPVDSHSLHKTEHPIVMYPLHEEVVGNIRSVLLTLLGAVGFVLLIACINIANLQLSRAESRQKEIAVRSAIGATQLRLLNQFLVEGLLLSFIGGLLGILWAKWGINLLIAANPKATPRTEDIGIDIWVLLFTFGISIVTSILFAVAPLIHVRTLNLYSSLKSAGHTSSHNRRKSLFRRGLVVTEVAFATVLLIGSGLMIRSFRQLQQLDLGFNNKNLLMMQIRLPRGTYQNNNSVVEFWSQVQRELTGLPGSVSATVMSGVPPVRSLDANDTEIEGFDTTPNGVKQNVSFYQYVGQNYFKTMEVRLIEGRDFNETDNEGGPGVVIVNQTMARTFWPNASPVGKRVRPSFDGPWYTVVGVAANVKNAGLRSPAGTEMYFPQRQAIKRNFAVRTMTVALRSQGDPLALISLVKSKIRGIDSSLPIAKIGTMDNSMDSAVAQPRFVTLVLSVFSTIGLILAAVGVYGVMTYSVARRRQELGIRIAMGAKATDVLKLIMTEGLKLSSIGLVIGLIIAVVLARLVTSLFYGVSPTDPATFIGVIILLTIVAALACYIPAYRAMRTDPIQVLRYE